MRSPCASRPSFAQFCGVGVGVGEGASDLDANRRLPYEVRDRSTLWPDEERRCWTTRSGTSLKRSPAACPCRLAA